MEKGTKRLLTGKWRLMAYAVLLGIIVTLWRPLFECCLLVRGVATEYVEAAGIRFALYRAGIPIASFKSGLKQGMSLRLDDASVKDLSPLKGSGLFLLDLRGTAVTNLDVVATMPCLHYLVLSKRQVTENLDLLRGLKMFVGENGSEYVLPGGIAWSNRYERLDGR